MPMSELLEHFADPGDWSDMIALSCPLGEEDDFLAHLETIMWSFMYQEEIGHALFTERDVTAEMLAGTHSAPYRTPCFLLVYLKESPWAYVIGLPFNYRFALGYAPATVYAGHDPHGFEDDDPTEACYISPGERRIMIFNGFKQDLVLVENGPAAPPYDHPYWEDPRHDSHVNVGYASLDVEVPVDALEYVSADHEVATATMWAGPNRLEAGPPEEVWNRDEQITVSRDPFQPHAEAACRELDLVIHACLGSLPDNKAAVRWSDADAKIAADLPAVSVPELSR